MLTSALRDSDPLYFIIGFSFSMAISRYDVRKNCEQAEAIAIGTEYSRTDLLASGDAVTMRMLLKRYLDPAGAVLHDPQLGPRIQGQRGYR